jgi:two-component system sensor kinase FixL
MIVARRLATRCDGWVMTPLGHSVTSTAARGAAGRSALRYAGTGLSYVIAYVALDWISYIHPVAQLAITPWNPPPGLSLFLLLRFGLRYAPCLFVAAVAAELVVRGTAPPPLLVLLSSLLLTAGYTAAGALLAGPLRVGARLGEVRDVNRFVAVAIAAPAPIAVAFVGLHIGLGSLTVADFSHAVLQFWIGDALGIVVTTPLLLEFSMPRAEPRTRFDVELLFQAAATVAALWIVFGLQATDEFKFFYLLFLPLVWIAMRRGIRGAMAASLAVQLGLVAAAESVAEKGIVLWQLQLLMLALALTALYLGTAVSEREAARRSVAVRDAALHRALRMATAGELAAAVAHELNQPLTAIGAYVRACMMMSEDPGSAARIRETLGKTAAEVARAGEVIRNLRGFYRAGTGKRERIAPRALVDAVVESLGPRLAQHRITLDLEQTDDPASIEVDRIQMQTVLHNLLVNAVDALAARAEGERRIVVRLGRREGGAFACEIADNGPGIAPDVAGRLFEPFTSTKTDGMGLGLAMSRSIVEAHGGRLSLLDREADGTTFEIILPFETTETTP